MKILRNKSKRFMKIIFEFKMHNTEPIWRILSIAKVPIPTLGVHQILDDALLFLFIITYCY
jgi:hypothetical protein